MSEVCKLEGGSVRGVHLEGGSVRGVHLEGGCVRGVHLEGGSVRGVHLEGGSVRGVQARGLEGGCVRGVHLEGGSVRGVHLEGGSVRGVQVCKLSKEKSPTLPRNAGQVCNLLLADFVLYLLGSLAEHSRPKHAIVLYSSIRVDYARYNVVNPHIKLTW